MQRIRLRNAFFRGWFAARGQRRPPDCDNSSELAYIERGFKAGLESGGRALPMRGHHRALPSEPPQRGDIAPPVRVPALDLEVEPGDDAELLHPERGEDPAAAENDVPLLTEFSEQDGDAPMLKQKPQSRSRFWQD